MSFGSSLDSDLSSDLESVDSFNFIDKFTKWIEAVPVTSADAASVVSFIKVIVFRFGVPNNIVMDNSSNFTSKEFKAYCEEVGDLVLRLTQDSHEKSESPWIGPYIVTEVIPGEAYRLKDKKSGKEEGNQWNVAQLRRFYA
ncbi:hypothetical protein QYE76_034180 [Lolium multiflorum]|uniref:Integrase catalytic domain-containing protein n=1 Tax=Lolium multiflorum TaxID=4521 RepID=A0AAD8QXJ3_LOLMU|nr:hypothetical protein QYE76_034180 [Lolium multiflorum]